MTNESDTPLPQLPPRNASAHKGNFGRAMLVGGSRDMPGSIAMSGMACVRSGAGLVTLGTPRCTQAAVASFCPVIMTKGLVDDDGGVLHWANLFDLENIADEYDVWAIGPGLGNPNYTSDLAGRMHRDWAQPLVVDADGLNAIAVFEKWRTPVLTRPLGARVLTPHPGEYGRLIGDETLARKATGDDDARIEAATALAARDETNQTIVVLKGARTVVAAADRYAINTTGNPGMASGGTGDVLTGVITGLLAQGMPPFQAARLGAHVHGLAGDLAAESLGQVSLMATDLIDYLPVAFKKVAGSR